MVESLTILDGLKKVHGVVDEQDPNARNRVLVIGEEDVAGSTIAWAEATLPGFEVVCARNQAEIALSLEEMRQRTALVVAEAGTVPEDLPDEAVLAVLPQDDTMGPEAISVVVTEALMAKLEVLEDADREDMEVVLRAFFPYCLSVAEQWKKTLGVLTEALGEDKVRIIRNCLVKLEKYLNDGKELSEARGDGEELDTGAMRKVCHDIKNALLGLGLQPQILLMKADTPEDIRPALESFAARVTEFVHLIKAFSETLKGGFLWMDLISLAPGLTGESGGAMEELRVAEAPVSGLELARGKTFLVIDNEAHIQAGCESVIGIAGGFVKAAYDPDGVSRVLDEGGKIDVVLLDDSLDDNVNGLKGHELISLIRAKAPGAIIIGHTTAARQLNKNPDNPYAKAGVLVVDKYNWAEINGVLQRAQAADVKD